MTYRKLLPLLPVVFPLWVNTQPLKQYTRIEVQEDLHFLQQALYLGHPSTFRYRSRTSLDSLFQAEAGALPDTVSHRTAYAAISRCVAALGCAHTYLTSSFYTDESRLPPIAVQVLDEKLYITRCFDPESTIIPGSEMISIDAIPAAQLLAEMRALRSGDGYNMTFRDELTGIFFGLYHDLLYGEMEVHQVQVRVNGTVRDHRIRSMNLMEIARQKLAPPAVSAQDPEPLLQMSRLRFRLMPDHKTGILDIEHFDSGYRRFHRKLFAALNEYQVTHLVIDVRGNTGGDLRQALHLVRQIVDSPVKQQLERTPASMRRYLPFSSRIQKGLAFFKYDVLPGKKRCRVNGRKYYVYRFRPVKKNNFQGQVYVLTDALSLSSSSMLASYLNQYVGAMIIGEETGGGEFGNNGRSFPTLVLPNSSINIKLPLYHITYHSIIDTGRGVLPDHPVRYKIEDILQQRDLEMEKALDLISSGGP